PGISVTAASADGAAVSFVTAATDLVTGAVRVDCRPASGSQFAVGSTQVTCSATDDAGNLARGAFAVAVGETPEETPPSFAAYADLTAEATGPRGARAVYDAPAATDADGNAATVSCAPASGTQFAPGATRVGW